MLSQIVLLGFLRRDLARADEKMSTQQNSCRAWQLVSRKYNYPAPVSLRAQKICPISLLQIATGTYAIYATTPSQAHGPSHADRADTALIVHPVYGRDRRITGSMSVEGGEQKLTCTTPTEDSGYGSNRTSPIIFPQDEVLCGDECAGSSTYTARQEDYDHGWSGTAIYDAFHAWEFPAYPYQEFVPLPSESLDTAQLAALAEAKAQSDRSKTEFYSPVPKKLSKSTFWLLARDSRLSKSLLAILEVAEQEFEALYDDIQPSAEALFVFLSFGCSFDALVTNDIEAKESEIQLFPLELYHAVEAAKEEYGIDEFDPASLVDGGIRSHTIEADFMDELTDELKPLFITYLRHLALPKTYILTNKTWQAQFRLDRACAEFEDNAFLRAFLHHEAPFYPIPFGRNPMIQEYWRRRGHDYSTLKDEYFRVQRQHATQHEHEWLTDDAADEVNMDFYIGYYEPSHEPLNLEIPELQRLGVRIVTEHPTDADFAHRGIKARAYEHWEPMEPGGEETFPDCPEGFEAWKCLTNYQSREEYPPAYLEDCERRERKREEVATARKDSMSPRLGAGWVAMEERFYPLKR